jgi:thioredoxin-related protein
MRRTLALLALASLLLSPACGKRGETTADAPGVGAALSPGELHWLSYGDGVARAAAENKPMLIDFWTDWCHWCKVMDKDTYSNEEVRRRLTQHFVTVKVDAESAKPQGGPEAATGVELASSFQVSGFPTTWFVDSQGVKIAPLPSFVPPDQFVVILDYIASGAYKSQKFEDYQATRPPAAKP